MKKTIQANSGASTKVTITSTSTVNDYIYFDTDTSTLHLVFEKEAPENTTQRDILPPEINRKKKFKEVDYQKRIFICPVCLAENVTIFKAAHGNYKNIKEHALKSHNGARIPAEKSAFWDGCSAILIWKVLEEDLNNINLGEFINDRQ